MDLQDITLCAARAVFVAGSRSALRVGDRQAAIYAQVDGTLDLIGEKATLEVIQNAGWTFLTLARGDRKKTLGYNGAEQLTREEIFAFAAAALQKLA